MKYERPAARSIQVVPIPTASFSSSHREQNAPFSAFQKQRGQDISPVPLCFFLSFFSTRRKEKLKRSRKVFFSSFLIFKRKKERSNPLALWKTHGVYAQNQHVSIHLPPSSNLILSFVIEEVLFLCYDRNRKTPMTGMAASLFIARLARST